MLDNNFKPEQMTKKTSNGIFERNKFFLAVEERRFSCTLNETGNTFHYSNSKRDCGLFDLIYKERFDRIKLYIYLEENRPCKLSALKGSADALVDLLLKYLR